MIYEQPFLEYFVIHITERSNADTSPSSHILFAFIYNMYSDLQICLRESSLTSLNFEDVFSP